jgi:SUMO ligase MMS21 Smc5/6 complex component
LVHSTVCKHSFSADAIRDYFKNSHGQAMKCPASGCNKKFRLADCQTDNALAKKIKDHKRRVDAAAAAAADDSDIDEVID